MSIDQLTKPLLAMKLNLCSLALESGNVLNVIGSAGYGRNVEFGSANRTANPTGASVTSHFIDLNEGH